MENFDATGETEFNCFEADPGGSSPVAPQSEVGNQKQDDISKVNTEPTGDDACCLWKRDDEGVAEPPGLVPTRSGAKFVNKTQSKKGMTVSIQCCNHEDPSGSSRFALHFNSSGDTPGILNPSGKPFDAGRDIYDKFWKLINETPELLNSLKQGKSPPATSACRPATYVVNKSSKPSEWEKVKKCQSKEKGFSLKPNLSPELEAFRRRKLAILEADRERRELLRRRHSKAMAKMKMKMQAENADSSDLDGSSDLFLNEVISELDFGNQEEANRNERAPLGGVRVSCGGNNPPKFIRRVRKPSRRKKSRGSRHRRMMMMFYSKPKFKSKYSPSMEALRQRNIAIHEETRRRRAKIKSLQSTLHEKVMPKRISKKLFGLADISNPSPREVMAEMELFDDISQSPVMISCARRVGKPCKSKEGSLAGGDGVTPEQPTPRSKRSKRGYQPRPLFVLPLSTPKDTPEKEAIRQKKREILELDKRRRERFREKQKSRASSVKETSGTRASSKLGSLKLDPPKLGSINVDNPKPKSASTSTEGKKSWLSDSKQSHPTEVIAGIELSEGINQESTEYRKMDGSGDA